MKDAKEEGDAEMNHVPCEKRERWGIQRPSAATVVRQQCPVRRQASRVPEPDLRHRGTGRAAEQSSAALLGVFLRPAHQSRKHECFVTW